MSKTMKASVLCDVKRLEVRDIPRPVISPYEVLIRVSAVGLCGTDVHIFAGHANYNTNDYGQPIPLAVQPQILGHEITGVVEQVGTAVSDLREGDRVVVDQGLNCVSRRREVLCDYCRSENSHQCELYREHGITGLPGGLAEFIAVPAVNAVKIAMPLEPATAALVEPVGCIIHSSDTVAKSRTRHAINAESAELRVRSVLICGAGPAGLLFTQYLRNVLEYEGLLFVSDPNEHKRLLAKRFGADEVIDPIKSDLVEVIHERTGGKGVEYLIEASGSGGVFRVMPGLIRKQATVLLYGHGHAGTDLSVLSSVLFKEPVLVSSVGASGGFEGDGRPVVYRRALNLIEQKRIDATALITHRYTSFEDVEKALSSDIHGDDYVKGVVVLATDSHG
ncbi:MAG TPA: alcohol dehydrogenase catalytic domain-containing protein [Pyrinomonadaceae bacterium]|jgi:threonine dehydrogenase-like Zn-dependent dehydrogenase|nr:alcohol dehydrogenase catalytic domain-containing protein [Pyrinomonadaceae bacterium]